MKKIRRNFFRNEEEIGLIKIISYQKDHQHLQRHEALESHIHGCYYDLHSYC